MKDMSIPKPRKVISVTELIDRIVVNMIARRPENWQAIARENGVKSVVLSEPWKGDFKSDQKAGGSQ